VAQGGHAFRKAEVARVSNLLCRRLPVGRSASFAALADWKSAIRQTGSLRYGVLYFQLVSCASVREVFGDSLGAGTHVELLVNASDIIAYSMDAYFQVSGNLFVGETFGKTTENFLLAL
jgi:hypothetical protein